MVLQTLDVGTTILLLGHQALFDGSYELVSLLPVLRSQFIFSGL